MIGGEIPHSVLMSQLVFTRLHARQVWRCSHPPEVAKIALSVRSTDKTFCMAQKKPVGIVVRRGALRRFDALTRKTADLPVVLSWDRRTTDRRTSREPVPVELRSSDRRKTPPFTWEVADFVVVDTPEEQDTAMTPPVPHGRTRE